MHLCACNEQIKKRPAIKIRAEKMAMKKRLEIISSLFAFPDVCAFLNMTER